MPESVLRDQVGFMRLLQQVAVAANEAATPETALQFSLDAICTLTGWPIGHVYRLPEDGSDALVPTGLWHMDDPARFADFHRVTEATVLPPGVGLPGRILLTGEPLWVMDVSKDDNFPRAAMATDIGVRAGFGFPVLIGQEVVAVLEFFAAEAKEPDEPLLDVLAHIGTQLGRVIERQRASRRQAELLAQAEAARAEAERANRIRQELLAMVSHDLRTPLTSIQLRAQSLAREAPEGQGGDRLRRHAGEIQRQVGRLQDMIRDLLDHAAIEAGRLSLSRTLRALPPLIDEAVSAMGPLLAKKALQVEVTVPMDLPELDCDADRIHQVLVNLLGNAVKFTPDGGRIQVGASRFGTGALRVTISDTGPGVPEMQRESLFQAFAKGSGTAGVGAGLGLAIAKGIVEGHGGRIWYEPAATGGSTFAFELPLAAAEPGH
jgi:signal transduction histidine kinase